MEYSLEKLVKFDKSLGQSKIEYIMTYGWMLLVITIVSAAVILNM